MKIRSRHRAGFTLVEMMIVVSIVGLLAAMAIPRLVKARQTSHTNACINNLRQIDNAKEQWALELGKTIEAPTLNEIQPYFGRGTAGYLDNVYCPLTASPGALAGYIINAVGTLPGCDNFSAGIHPALLQ